MKEEIKEIRAAFERIGKLLDQMEGVPTATEVDPLEGKQVEGFIGVKNIGLNYGEQHLWYFQGNGRWGIATTTITPTPHHLTRVTERTVGRFYLIEDSNGDKPYHFGLYLGGKYVRWTAEANYPLYVSDSLEYLSMYEVTPTI